MTSPTHAAMRSVLRDVYSVSHSIPRHVSGYGLKRAFDVIVAFLILVPAAIFLFPLIALLIKLTSAGPVFFIQQRSGVGNSVFRLYKFRTMQMNRWADLRQATASDSRITRIGYFLRIFHLDELPQLINVLRGEMSLIGPRPHMLYHTETYSQTLPYYYRRLDRKPGITGLAQVMGYLGEIRNETELKKRVLYDIYYNRNASPGLDIFILLLTVRTLVGKFCSICTRKSGRIVELEERSLSAKTA